MILRFMESAYLHLTDGTSLQGTAFGYHGEMRGEVVFTTAMTGYEQSLTDPSFANQILVFTYPLVGNYGVAKPQFQDKHLVANFESEKIWANGVVLSSLPKSPFHYQSVTSFANWLTEQKIPGIARIDTRALTIKLRAHGVLAGTISRQKMRPRSFTARYRYTDVSCKKNVSYPAPKPNTPHVALLDCGVKHGIIRQLLHLGIAVTRIPWNVNPLDIGKFDAVVCSNGPGDPKNWVETVAIIKKILTKKIPFLGICLGHQLLSLAIGADTYKLKYGHRGVNQPVQEEKTRKCYITSQNHGYAVLTKTIPRNFDRWFTNLNDGTNEGICNDRAKIWSTQFHPEGEPGPFDTEWVFERLLTA